MRTILNGILSCALAVFSFAWHGEKALAAEGKTMELLVPSSPGGSRDVYARIVAQYMPRYLPGNPSIIVKNMPGAGGEIMLNYLYRRAKRDGSVFATGTNAMYRANRLGMSSTQYDLEKFNFIGAMPESPYLLVIRANHPVKTYKDLLETRKPVHFGMSAETGGGTVELVGHTLKNVLGANLNFVSGYRGSNQRVAAVLRGELDATLDRLATAEDKLEDGDLRILLLLTHGDKVPAKYRGNASEWFKLELTPRVRELSDFIVTPSDLDKTYIAPPGVPAEQVQILREAFDKTMADPKVQAILTQRGAISPVVSGETLEKEVVPRLLGVSDSTVETVKKWLGR